MAVVMRTDGKNQANERTECRTMATMRQPTAKPANNVGCTDTEDEYDRHARAPKQTTDMTSQPKQTRNKQTGNCNERERGWEGGR